MHSTATLEAPTHESHPSQPAAIATVGPGSSSRGTQWESVALGIWTWNCRGVFVFIEVAAVFFYQAHLFSSFQVATPSLRQIDRLWQAQLHCMASPSVETARSTQPTGRVSVLVTTCIQWVTQTYPKSIWATVNMWYIAPSHHFLKSVLSFFSFCYISIYIYIIVFWRVFYCFPSPSSISKK